MATAVIMLLVCATHKPVAPTATSTTTVVARKCITKISPAALVPLMRQEPNPASEDWRTTTHRRLVRALLIDANPAKYDGRDEVVFGETDGKKREQTCASPVASSAAPLRTPRQMGADVHRYVAVGVKAWALKSRDAGMDQCNYLTNVIRPGVSGEFFCWEGWARGNEVIEAVSRRAEGASGADGGRSAQRHGLGVGGDGPGC